MFDKIRGKLIICLFVRLSEVFSRYKILLLFSVYSINSNKEIEVNHILKCSLRMLARNVMCYLEFLLII